MDNPNIRLVSPFADSPGCSREHDVFRSAALSVVAVEDPVPLCLECARQEIDSEVAGEDLADAVNHLAEVSDVACEAVRALMDRYEPASGSVLAAAPSLGDDGAEGVLPFTFADIVGHAEGGMGKLDETERDWLQLHARHEMIALAEEGMEHEEDGAPSIS